jgi:hypothetical protein
MPAAAAHQISGKRGGEYRRNEHEVDQPDRHHRQRDWAAHQHEIDVGEGGDEGEQDQEADAEGGAQRRIAQMRA